MSVRRPGEDPGRGGVNLHQTLASAQVEVCRPRATEPEECLLNATGLYDPTPPLRGAGHVVGNDLLAAQRPLILITGANTTWEE